MNALASTMLPALLVLTGLAAWLTLAVCNNMRDPGTNHHLLGLMIRMDLIKEDPMLGNGLEHRALLAAALPQLLLRIVVAGQILVAGLLWLSAAALAAHALADFDRTTTVAVANVALSAFAGLWLVFLCGGLWFGYWINIPQVQQVHFTLLMIAMLAFVLIDRVP